MRKWLFVFGLVLVAAVGMALSGCLIDPPPAPNRVANVIRLSPKYLEALPSGMIYQGWLVRGDTVDAQWQPHDISEWVSFGRFDWDPDNHRPVTESGAPLENRFDAGVDVLSFHRILITLEPTGAGESPLPSGVVILEGDVDLLNIDADLEHPISTADISDFDKTENQFWIYTQSDGTQFDDSTWYDTSSADMGIWFGSISKANRIVFDTLCRDPIHDTAWFTCPEGELPDTIYWCHTLDDIDTLADTTLDTITVEPLVVDTTIDTTIDTSYVVEECLDSLRNDADSTLTHDTLYVIYDGDTSLATSLNTMPEAVAGWKYQTWLIFKNGAYPPLSLGRFTDPKGPDDDSSYCLQATYDRHFSIPGEDFFQNVPVLGSLRLVSSGLVDKLYITVEPDPDFDPANPFLQLIMFSAYIPPPNVFYQLVSGVPSQRPAQRVFPLVLRDIGYELNEGHRWPTMHIDLEREMIVPK